MTCKGEAPRADLTAGKSVRRAGPEAGGRKKTGQHPVLEPFMFMQTTSVGETELASIIVCCHMVFAYMYMKFILFNKNELSILDCIFD